MNSSRRVHNVTGTWFDNTFGLNYRTKAIFCTGNIETAKGYLKTHKWLLEIKPNGPYRICFSATCKDLFGHFQFLHLPEDDNCMFEATIRDSLQTLKYVEHKNSGIDVAAASGSEVMLYAEQFSYKRIA